MMKVMMQSWRGEEAESSKVQEKEQKATKATK